MVMAVVEYYDTVRMRTKQSDERKEKALKILKAGDEVKQAGWWR
jgi:preprotein translocase subunit YajC